MSTLIVIGRVGKDPVTKETASGSKVTNFTLACNQKIKGENVTTWYYIDIWGGLFDKILPWIRKGNQLQVRGELQPPSIFESNGVQKINLHLKAEGITFINMTKEDEAPKAEAQMELPF